MDIDDLLEDNFKLELGKTWINESEYTTIFIYQAAICCGWRYIARKHQ